MTVYSILWAVNLELNSVLGNEGRAGMTAIVDDPQLDLSTLAKRLSTALPAYARPVFVRLLSKMDTTGGLFNTEYIINSIQIQIRNYHVKVHTIIC